MKTKLFVILTLIFCINSFAQIKAVKKTSKMKKVSKPMILVKEKGVVKITMISPANEAIVYTNSPNFKYTLSKEVPHLQTAQTKSAGSKTVVLTVVKITDDPNWVAENHIVLQEEILSNINTGVSKTFSNLSLSLNHAYAWNIEFKGETPNEENMKWNVFYYFDKETVVDNSDPHACNTKYIFDPSFKDKGHWKTTNTSFNSYTNANTVSNGHDDTGAGMITSPNTIIYQRLQTPIKKDKNYQLKFSIKRLKEKSSFKIKAIAFNGTLNSLTPNANIAIMTLSGNIPYYEDWNKITLSAWKAHKDFENIALVFIPENNRARLNLLIDRVCLDESKSACEENNLTYDIGNASGNENITVTNEEYLVGTVQDLYPNQDTSTLDWYANIADDCLSIGGDDAEEDAIQPNAHDAIEIEKAEKELEEIENKLIKEAPEYFKPKNGIQPIVYNGKAKCSDKKPALDPTKPFGGRDVVYIHGLQLSAIMGNLKPSPTFQGKWPDDKNEFYKGGEFYNEAKGYWENHIKRGLGSAIAPSNSYLIVSYSANQRLEVAIHAVLTQIRDAMAGENIGVVKSNEQYKNKRCFGSNGIVVVTHSTGGLVASTMFSIAEKSGTNQTYKDYYGDVRFITNKIDAQIGFDAAYGGSPLATTGIAVLAGLTINPVLKTAAKVFFQNNNLQQHANFSPTNTILFDLTPMVSKYKWRPLMRSSIPTLIMTGSTTGKSAEGLLTFPGNLLIRGFDDGVLSNGSQSSHIKRRPGFMVKNRGKLVDKGTPLMKRKAIVQMSKSGKNFQRGERNYYISPFLSPTGMLQGNSVRGIVDRPGQFIHNHFTILQTTGDHFDNVDEVARGHDNNYGYTDGDGLLNRTNLGTPFRAPRNKIKNNEETPVVSSASLYSSGLLNSDFASLNQEWIKKETWGLHLPRLTMVRKCVRLFRKERCIKVPKITWHYHEFIKWQRKYHLLKDYETKMGMDYMYEYILR
ncbi:hypothetical protein MC378_08115 [Polaribacter sp. MSW13]|uniref:Uncharacterized protein n=2 Tax=Polaribacter marinus TaxID=2916838 RepID=A0A9X1VN58_9FLAO|nr:hypothetical protein [Polaribacter marinus]